LLIKRKGEEDSSSKRSKEEEEKKEEEHLKIGKANTIPTDYTINLLFLHHPTMF